MFFYEIAYNFSGLAEGGAFGAPTCQATIKFINC